MAIFYPLARRLLAWEDNDPFQNWVYVFICLLLTLMAGLMSGLTLGLLSLDTVDLEVLLRSGTPKEQKYARKIMPIVSNSHLLLVTLLFCNAISMEALPLYLDKLADPVSAVIVSVTAVLFFGEIIPQSVCSRYGLAVGANLAPFVRLLMWVCSPVAWPMGKLLDLLLGPDHHTLFRRRQLKELVSMHAEDAGMGGALTTDEIKVITGALDLTNKVAYRAMTPLGKVFMLSSSDQLDEATLRAVLRSGHSRIPVHRQGDRADVVGLVLVKELLQYRLGASEAVPVAMLRMRSIPRLPATTPMYDMLRLFQTGRSHIAVLTQPPPGELQRLGALDPSLGSGGRARSGRHRGKGPTGGAADAADDGGGGTSATRPLGSGGGGGTSGATAGGAALRALTPPIDFDGRSVAAETEVGDTDAEAFAPYVSYRSGGNDSSFTASLLDEKGTEPGASGVNGGGFGAGGLGEAPPPSFRPWATIQSPSPPRYDNEEDDRDVASDAGGGDGGAATSDAGGAGAVTHGSCLRQSSAFAVKGMQEALLTDGAVAAALVSSVAPPALPTPPSPRAVVSSSTSLTAAASMGSHRLARMSHDAGASHAPAMAGVASGASGGANGSAGGGAALAAALAAAGMRGDGSRSEDLGGGKAGPAGMNGGGGPATVAAASTVAGDDGEMDYEDTEPEEGRPIGIITIEDVIEELIRSEIVDETDRYIDNDRRIKANQARLAASLPEHLIRVLAAAGGKKAALQRVRSYSGGAGGSNAGYSRRSLGLALGSGAGLASPREVSQHYAEGGLRAPLLVGEH